MLVKISWYGGPEEVREVLDMGDFLATRSELSGQAGVELVEVSVVLCPLALTVADQILSEVHIAAHINLSPDAEYVLRGNLDRVFGDIRERAYDLLCDQARGL